MYTPSIERLDSMPRHAFCSLIWVNNYCKAQAVYVDLYDITAVSIQAERGSVLLILVYNARDRREKG